MPSADIQHVDTVVIGAGQAGLAAAYYLKQQGVAFVVLDERPQVGDVWATRFDALRLFSPAWVSSLPGRSWSGNPLHYPTKDEAAEYLHEYAAHFQLPIRLGQRVASVALCPNEKTNYKVQTTDNQIYTCLRIIVCTGPYTVPAIPEFAPHLAPSLQQLHSRDYHRPAQVAGTGPVAVVGSGNSALQIASDLAESGRPVYVAYDPATPTLPNNQLMWVTLTATGLLRASRHTRLGRFLLRRPEPVVSSDLSRLRSFSNARFIGRAAGTEDHGHALRGLLATTPPLQAVLWATGYRPDYSWIQLPIFDAHGFPEHHRGLTAAPGVAFLGLPWLDSRRSALMGGAGDDARYVVEQLLKRP